MNKTLCITVWLEG